MRDRWSEVFAWISYSLGVIVMGGAALESSVYIPNWLHDMPASLERARAFLVPRNPGHFFQAVTPALIVLSIVTIVLAWRRSRVRNALIAGLVLLIAVEALTFALVYPRIGLLLGEGAAQRPIAELEAAASSLLLWGFRIRLLIMAAAVFGLYFHAARTMTVERAQHDRVSLAREG